MKVLKRGAVGPQVELLQLALDRSGSGRSKVDGIFGAQTYNNVLAFQKKTKISVDGVVGPQTWAALERWLTGFLLHTVSAGDSYYKIAARYATDIRAIDTANPGLDPLNLRVGQRIKVPLPFDVVPTNVSFTSTLMDYCVRGLRARYPFIDGGSAGNSQLGKPLYWLSIGAGELESFYNASHHANEWITTPILMKFLESYAKAAAFGGTISGQRAEKLFAETKLFLMPMVNPDGVDLVTGETGPGSRAWKSAEALSRNYPEISFPSGWKANITGVDLNLQYPAGWELARKTKFAQGYTSPAPRDYVGEAPLTQPEARAVYDFTLKHDFALTLSYHTQGEVIYWKYLDREPALSRRIGEKLAALSGYSLETTPTESAYAGYKDWFIQDYNRPGYTIEVGKGSAPLPISDFSGIYRANEAVLTFAMNAFNEL